MPGMTVHRKGAAGALVVLSLAVACREPPPDPHTPPDPLTEAEAAHAFSLGAPAAGALASGLVGELTEALETRGTAGAIGFCADEALELTRRIQDEHDPRLEIKRTSLRWRNPGNAPDPWEERVLRHLEALEALDPEAVPAELAAAGPEGTLRYYRVLRAAPMCLSCHGPLEELTEDVREILDERYPEDRATGYGAGEIRGVIRVSVPRE